jgi:hypothetical protein
MLSLVICALLTLSPLPQAPSSDGLSVTYRFENEMFLVSRIEVTIDASGRGRVAFTRKSLNRPVERPVVVGPQSTAEIMLLLERLNFLDSAEVYQSKSEHPNLGTVTLQVTRDGTSREARFNYTEHKDAEALAALLKGVATREMYAFDLETAARYYPLDTPDLIKALKEEIARKRVTEAVTLIPLLRDLAGNVGVPLIARNKAEELANALEKDAGRPSRGERR